MHAVPAAFAVLRENGSPLGCPTFGLCSRGTEGEMPSLTRGFSPSKTDAAQFVKQQAQSLQMLGQMNIETAPIMKAIMVSLSASSIVAMGLPCEEGVLCDGTWPKGLLVK